MKPKALFEKYLEERHMMQLATSVNGQPWCCTVYYVNDEDNNIYWASLPTRRHSQEIKQNPKVAVAIPVRHVKGEPVVGIQIQGRAEELEISDAYRAVSTTYAQKYNRDADWLEDFIAGKTNHKLYKLTPEQIWLFDEVNFPGGQRQQVL